MKIVSAIIKPFKLDDVRAALSDIGINGLTVYEVKGHGRQKGHVEVYRGSEYQVSFLPKTMCEIAIPAERLDEVVEKIIATVRTGQIGDGKIFVSTIDEVVRVRTGERGTDAL